jgi:hypothetical protein
MPSALASFTHCAKQASQHGVCGEYAGGAVDSLSDASLSSRAVAAH